MPKKTFYLSEDDLAIYEKAKGIAGDSVSSVIMQGLKDYVVKWEMSEFDYNTVQLFEGSEVHPDDVRQGQYFKFVGKLLAEDYREELGVLTINYQLYATRKGKYLLYTALDDEQKGVKTYSKVIKDDVAGLRELNLPPELLAKADKNMPDLFVEVLDI
ncbi:hypothetical protein GMST_42610 [Geomonas silvestris]|uniref:EXLDI protein n=1 Tax=Geomonas silvestris TaxID=2740184 RepID=A0A6V8MPE7_9BACT|nr:hypothetical protein [Geomonas silvestris]GFO61936.1 hypothetical protein GMST_42610 [Geomonas silvestris]